jgi:hypothetical protein
MHIQFTDREVDVMDARNALRHLTRKLFKGSAGLLFIHLVSDQTLSAKQIRTMRGLLANKSDTGEI